MTTAEHFTGLENMYLAAPVNRIYLPKINISEGQAKIEVEISEKYFHTAGAVHGSVYFKVLDDAAFFACNSLEREVFVLTTSFTTYITRPVSSGIMKSVGQVVNRTKSQFIAESVAYDGRGKEVARGNGVFVKSRIQLADIEAYTGGLSGS